jgi:hypothetical protein
MMTAREIGAVKLGSPQDLWNRLRSHSREVVLFRRFDAEPGQVKKDIEKGLELARKITFNWGFEAMPVSSCLISATMKVMPVQATWCPVNAVFPVFPENAIFQMQISLKRPPKHAKSCARIP